MSLVQRLDGWQLFKQLSCTALTPHHPRPQPRAHRQKMAQNPALKAPGDSNMDNKPLTMNRPPSPLQHYPETTLSPYPSTKMFSNGLQHRKYVGQMSRERTGGIASMAKYHDEKGDVSPRTMEEYVSTARNYGEKRGREDLADRSGRKPCAPRPVASAVPSKVSSKEGGDDKDGLRDLAGGRGQEPVKEQSGSDKSRGSSDGYSKGND